MRKHNRHEWTAEHVTMLRQWQGQGYSATEISALFAKRGVTYTRSAILGKLHRTGGSNPVLFTYQENQILRKENAALKQQLLELTRKTGDNHVSIQAIRLDGDDPAGEKAAQDGHPRIRATSGKG
jgi:hypothetical protein